MKGSIYCGSEWVFPYLYSCHPLAFLEIVRLDGSSTEWSYNSKQQPRSFFFWGGDYFRCFNLWNLPTFLSFQSIRQSVTLVPFDCRRSESIQKMQRLNESSFSSEYHVYVAVSISCKGTGDAGKRKSSQQTMEELHRRAPLVLRLLITKKSESTRGGQEGEKKKSPQHLNVLISIIRFFFPLTNAIDICSFPVRRRRKFWSRWTKKIFI